jgi:hypothetical protein
LRVSLIEMFLPARLAAGSIVVLEMWETIDALLPGLPATIPTWRSPSVATELSSAANPLAE